MKKGKAFNFPKKSTGFFLRFYALFNYICRGAVLFPGVKTSDQSVRKCFRFLPFHCRLFSLSFINATCICQLNKNVFIERNQLFNLSPFCFLTFSNLQGFYPKKFEIRLKRFDTHLTEKPLGMKQKSTNHVLERRSSKNAVLSVVRHGTSHAQRIDEISPAHMSKLLHFFPIIRVRVLFWWSFHDFDKHVMVYPMFSMFFQL